MNRSARGRFVVIGISLAAVLVPLLWTFAAAIDVLPDNQTSPPSWRFSPSLDQLANVSVVEPSFWQELIPSIAVSAVATALTVTVAMLASYGLARSGRRVGRPLAPLLLVLASLPAVAYVVPLSGAARRIGLPDTPAGPIVGPWRRALRRIGLLETRAGIPLAQAAAPAPLAVLVLFGYLGAVA